MIEKSLALVSLNVRGLGRASAKPKEIKAWLASLQAPPQIKLIQEHHIGKDDTQQPRQRKRIRILERELFLESCHPTRALSEDQSGNCHSHR
jgi:hypothetical protein